MKIQTITINNFRSIKSETIQFDNNCLILLGKNEAGKSNVLKAIAALFGQYNVTNKDKRKRIENEKITDYFVRAKFEYNETDIKNLYDNILKKYPTIKNLTFQNDKGLFDYIKEELPLIYYQIDIKDNSQANFIHDKGKNFNVIPSKDIYITGNVISTQSEGSKIELFSLLIDEIKVEYDKDPYKCILWHYNNNLLLPKSVNREQFIASPSNYRALENIFILCNRSNIAQEFKDAKEQDGDYENLLDQVSTAVTKTFREIWRDLRDTSIKLSSDGAEIRIKVVNKAKYAFEDRSDGFKKFISILLMLSTRARANKIGERNVILIDEPDQSLYPTSATHLRDELLKISKNCYVIYSTHCQYMIDSNCLERHLIVEKKMILQQYEKKKEMLNSVMMNY